jgi:hypothetical protein
MRGWVGRGEVRAEAEAKVRMRGASLRRGRTTEAETRYMDASGQRGADLIALCAGVRMPGHRFHYAARLARADIGSFEVAAGANLHCDYLRAYVWACVHFQGGSNDITRLVCAIRVPRHRETGDYPPILLTLAGCDFFDSRFSPSSNYALRIFGVR